MKNKLSALFGMTVLLAACFCLTSCGDPYQNGVDDGWGKSKNFILHQFNQEYQRGYAKGLEALGRYTKGCEDAEFGGQPDRSLEKDFEYMRGFSECS